MISAFLDQLLCAEISACFVFLLFRCLGVLRAWLLEKRELAAKGRVFTYRRFLTPKELERRRSCLAERVADRAVMWNPDIGLVLTEEMARGMTDYRVLCLPCIEHEPIGWTYPLPPIKPATYYREDFELHLLRFGTERFRALLIDPEDTAGLDLLCRDLDRVLERERFNRWYGRPSWA